MTEDYWPYKVEFRIYARSNDEYRAKYERMKRIAEERRRVLVEMAGQILKVAARVDEELEKRGIER